MSAQFYYEGWINRRPHFCSLARKDADSLIVELYNEVRDNVGWPRVLSANEAYRWSNGSWKVVKLPLPVKGMPYEDA